MTKMRIWGVMLAGAGTLAGCAPMPPQSQDDPIAYRLNQLEGRVEKLEGGQTSSPTLDVVSNQQQIQEDLRQLKGVVEQQAYQLQVQEQKLNQLTTTPAAPSITPGGTNSGLEQGQPTPMAPAPQEKTPPAPVPVTTAPPVAGEQANYDVAFNLLKEGRYPQAAEAFGQFLQQYPSSRLAPNAQYWLGEAEYVGRQFDTALGNFRKVVEQYPGNPKVPDALLKIGYIHAEKQQWAEAKSALDRVIREFPQSGAADLARQRLNRLQREGQISG